MTLAVLTRRVQLAGIENLGDKFYFEHLNSLNPFTRDGPSPVREFRSWAVMSLWV